MDGLEAQMKKVEISNNPVDIAALVYVRGQPLIGVVRIVDFNDRASN